MKKQKRMPIIEPFLNSGYRKENPPMPKDHFSYHNLFTIRKP